MKKVKFGAIVKHIIDRLELLLKGGFIKKDLKIYNALNTRENFKYNKEKKFFIWKDKYAQAGSCCSYLFQDLWAAKLIYKNNPEKHFDIGSRIDGLITHILTFKDEVTLIDIRPFETKIPGVKFIQSDATNLDAIEDNSIESISALCSLEHFGLGRYGDPINPEACFMAFKAIQKKLKPGGYAYISIPIGQERLEFNAHRIFYAKTILEEFNEMELIEFSTTDGNSIEYNPPVDKYDSNNDRWDIFGLFCFRKK